MKRFCIQPHQALKKRTCFQILCVICIAPTQLWCYHGAPPSILWAITHIKEFCVFINLIGWILEYRISHFQNAIPSMCSGAVTTFNLAVLMKYSIHNVPTHTPKQCEKMWWVNNSTVIHIIWSCSFLLRYQCVLWVLNSKYALLTYFIGIGSRKVEPCTRWNWRQRVPPPLCTYIPPYHQLLSLLSYSSYPLPRALLVRSSCMFTLYDIFCNLPGSWTVWLFNTYTYTHILYTCMCARGTVQRECTITLCRGCWGKAFQKCQHWKSIKTSLRSLQARVNISQGTLLVVLNH